MADNSVRTPGSGETIASDDIGGVKWQRMKMAVGADGAALDVQPPADNLTKSVTVPAVHMVLEETTGTVYMARTAGTDAQLSNRLAAAGGMLYNGATFDRQRGNTEGTLLAARTATTTSANQTNYNARGVILTLNVTAAGTGTLQLRLDAIDPVSGNNFAAALGTASAGTQRTLMAYPGVIDADHSDDGRSVVLPRTWTGVVIKSDASSWTYSLGYALVV